MKKIILIIVIVITTISAFTQDNKSGYTYSKEVYLKKAKSQNTAAWFLMASGLAGTVVSITLAGIDAQNSLSDLFTFTPDNRKNHEKASTIFGVAGLTLMAGSIPLFIASSRNKKNSRSISTTIKVETFSTIQKTGFIKKNYPVIALKVNL